MATHQCSPETGNWCGHRRQPWHYAELITYCGAKPDLGPLLRAHREHRQVSQEQLSAESGVSRSTIQRIETGIRPMTRTEAAFLAEALDITVKQLGWS